MVCPSSVKLIISLREILPEKSCLTVFQIMLLSEIELRSKLEKYCCLTMRINLWLFPIIISCCSFLSFRNLFLNFDLIIIAFLTSLVIKMAWLALWHFFFREAYLSKILRNVLKKCHTPYYLYQKL